MMPVAAICPFYKAERSKLIYCEFARINPPDKKARDEIVFTYCANSQNYRNCPFYKALEGYYDRKYENASS